jgi:hypothetical protein
MLPTLLKRLLAASDETELRTLRVGKVSAQPVCFRYTFVGDDGLIKGEVVLNHQTHTYTDFSFKTFGLVPATSPQGVFLQESFGDILLDFKINFSEGDESDTLTGRLTLLNWGCKKHQGQWRASVCSSDREVAVVKGTWLRSQDE